MNAFTVTLSLSRSPALPLSRSLALSLSLSRSLALSHSGNIDKKFAAHYDAIEQQLKSETVGLVTLDEMKAKQEDAVKVRT